MKKIALLFTLLFATPAAAGVPCSLPFNLQNATIADATQVMANYNAIITCLGNAAAAGANNDITSLSALVTQIPPSQGGTTLYVGAASTGTNAQLVSSTVPTPFVVAAGRQVLFVVGSGNTGATTLNVGSSGPINLYRRTQLGISAMVGGELVAGQPALVVYDGSEYVLMNNGPFMVGEIRSYAGIAAPLGWAFIDGSCASRTTYPDLFSIITTAYDPTGTTCDTAHFALPDGRGRALVGLDNMGVNGAANRITSAGSGCAGTTIGGAGCGAQTHQIALAELPAHHHSVFLHDPGHQHSIPFITTPTSVGSTNVNVYLVGSGNTTGVSQTSITPQSAADSGTFPSNTPNGTANQTADSVAATQATPVLPPLQIVTQIIKL